MITRSEFNEALETTRRRLKDVRQTLLNIKVDDNKRGYVNDPERRERMSLEASRLRGIFYNLEGLFYDFSEKHLNYIINDAYKVLMDAEDRAKLTDMDNPRWDEFMHEARIRSNIFHALAAVKVGNHDDLLKEINRTFLN